MSFVPDIKTKQLKISVRKQELSSQRAPATWLQLPVDHIESSGLYFLVCAKKSFIGAGVDLCWPERSEETHTHQLTELPGGGRAFQEHFT